MYVVTYMTLPKPKHKILKCFTCLLAHCQNVAHCPGNRGLIGDHIIGGLQFFQLKLRITSLWGGGGGGGLKMKLVLNQK